MPVTKAVDNRATWYSATSTYFVEKRGGFYHLPDMAYSVNRDLGGLRELTELLNAVLKDESTV